MASCGAAVGQLEPAVFPVHLPVQQLKFSDSGPSQSSVGVTSSMHHVKGSRIYNAEQNGLGHTGLVSRPEVSSHFLWPVSLLIYQLYKH